ncbi:hypothetical protein B0T18DRAFT_437439 [Schizothecium vesticola]|uniref:Aminoglycoside phosphotransferase domain-containing protein n=1 Tax=Schizothecium vesticola TaxID=314040 RepID=A0AA40F2P5_9PEZI|nr:hypothetical protein B0T18DRAFT_437439 [Schizothecium vesticola]
MHQENIGSSFLKRTLRPHERTPTPTACLPQRWKTDASIVTAELLEHVPTLKALRSDTPGTRPARRCCVRAQQGPRPARSGGRRPISRRGATCFVPTNDLGQHNVIVDPDTRLKINAVIDWEYGGFWPELFERPYWKRKGSSAPLGGEEDDRERCREWLLANCEEVGMEQLRSLKERMGE